MPFNDENQRPEGFVKNNWVRETDVENPYLGKIKEVYWDRTGNEWVMNVVLYKEDGTHLGRVSPKQGGPSSFEPCVPCEDWQVIDEPDFV